MKLVISLAVPLAVGGIASFFTRSEIDGWFQTIRKPDWQPPNWLFAPVWTTLYLMMGAAFYLLWKSPAATDRKRAMGLWMAQLAFNFFWSILFFNRHQIGWALADIILLWLLILLTIFAFAKISKPAAWLLVPYISWVSFAGLLNAAIFSLN